MAAVVPSLSWINKSVRGESPSPRQGHAIARLGNTVYVFGGSSTKLEASTNNVQTKNTDGNILFYNDLYQLKLGNHLEWTRLTQVGEIPSKRDGHCLCVIGTMLYLVGGKNHLLSNKSLKGLYVFDPDSLNWQIYETEGPEPRTLNNSVSVVDDNMYVFGGILNSKASNSLYMLNTQKLHWTQIETYGVPPEPRCDHAAAVVKKKIYIFGGSGGEKIWFNDLHIYDAATSTWSAPKIRGKAPIARGCHSFTTHKDKEIFVFGGFNDTYEGNNGTFGEMCKFSVGKMKWKYPFHTGTKPTERYGHTTFICHGRIFIIGGMDELTYFNEIQVAKIINPAERKKVLITDIDDVTTANPPHVKADTSSIGVTSEIKPLLQRTDREHNERLTPNWMRNSASSVMGNVNSSFNIHPLDTDTSMASISRLSLNGTQPRSYSTPNLGHNSPPRFPFESTYNPNSLPPLGGQLKRQNSKAGSSISSISMAEKDAVKRVSKAFRILQERFDEIDEERRLLENDKVTLNNDKERFLEQYRNQQRDIQQILEQHRLQNQEWLQQRTLDLEREKEEVARQRAKLTAEYQQLIHEERFRERTSNFTPPMSSYSGTV